MLAAAPATLRTGSREPQPEYTLADDLVARHGAEPAEATLSHEGGSISIVGHADADAPGVEAGAVGPVYRAAHGGAIAVPTGRALVRFADDDAAERHRDELAAAGFDLEQPLSYAPQAGWVRASSGLIADTLSGLERLAQLPRVEHVEPQLISDAARR